MLIERFLRLVAPHRCLACAAEGDLFCMQCMQKLPLLEQVCYGCDTPSAAGITCQACASEKPLYSVQAPALYAGSMKDLVGRLKFERASAAVDAMARWWPTVALPSEATVITYIPTDQARMRARGYDQARLLAKSASQHYKLPMIPLLARTSHARQVGSSGAQRRHQMAHAFRPINDYTFQNKHVIIVDDVITTGSTLEAAGRILLDSGAARVSALAFAQARMK